VSVTSEDGEESMGKSATFSIKWITITVVTTGKVYVNVDRTFNAFAISLSTSFLERPLVG